MKSLLKFGTANRLTNMLVTTIDREGTQVVNGINLHFFPAATYAYTVGKNTLRKKGA